nr:conserved hypothetical protein [Rhizobiaceae bacterium]
MKLAGRMLLPEPSSPCLRIRRPLLLLLCHADSFLRWRSGGRGAPSDQAMIEPMGAMNAICADMQVLPKFRGLRKRNRRRWRSPAAEHHSEGSEACGYSAAMQ